MTKNRLYKTPTAVGSFTAAVALLAGLSAANAQAPAPGAPLSGAGSFPGSFIVPGTNTSLHVGGVVQFDTSIAMDAAGASTSPGGYDNANLTGIGVHGAGVTPSTANNEHGVMRLQDISTRPNVETRTPSPYGEIKTYWELDFSGSQSEGGTGTAGLTGVPAIANSPPGAGGATATPCCSNLSVARLKQAYGTIGPWLFGMANSNWVDLDAWPDSLDGGGDAGGYGFNGTRYKPQVRYTYLLPNGISLSSSVWCCARSAS